MDFKVKRANKQTNKYKNFRKKLSIWKIKKNALQKT